MIKSAKVAVFILILLNLNVLFSQNIHKIDIEQGLKLFEINSEQFKQINRNVEIESIKYSIFGKAFYPRVNLNISLPAYSKAINSITLPNGNNIFIEQSQANGNLNLNISQKIPFTGGEIIVNSSINRLDNLTSKSKSYSSNWFNIILNQPLTGYNSFKWFKKMNEVSHLKSKIELIKDFEKEKTKFIETYFDVYTSQYKIFLTNKNIKITTEYLSQLEELYKQGRVLKPELLQTELSLNQLKYKYINDVLEYSHTLHHLKRQMDISENDSIELIEPLVLEKIVIDEKKLKERLAEYTLDTDFSTVLLESAQKLAKAKSEKGLQVNFQVGYGLNSNSKDINKLYEIPSRKEYLNFGLTIPIINWNENSKLYQIQKLLDESTKSRYKEGKIEIDDKVQLLLNSFEGLYNQINFSTKNREIININSKIANELLLLNRLTINNYNEESFKEDKVFIDFLNVNKSLWLFKFYLRTNTLFDFFENKDLLSK